MGHNFILMDSISNTIKKQIAEDKAGKIYFISDFNFHENEEAVKKAFFRLEKNDFLVRLSHGIYLYPVRSERLGVMYPSMEEIAQAIAIRDKADIMATGALAMNLLGFSTQVPMNVVYITNGSPRKIQIGKRKITFKKAAPKFFYFKSDVMALLVFALKEMGQSNVDDKVISRIEEVFSIKKELSLYRGDLSLVPVWMKKILVPIINKLAHE